MNYPPTLNKKRVGEWGWSQTLFLMLPCTLDKSKKKKKVSKANLLQKYQFWGKNDFCPKA